MGVAMLVVMVVVVVVAVAVRAGGHADLWIGGVGRTELALESC